MDKNTALFDFGYNFLGPICGEYFHKLDSFIQTLDNPRLLFLAREGYFFDRVYNGLVEKQLIPTLDNDYLYVSRTFLFRINIADIYTWQWSLTHKFKGTLQKLLTGRFGFHFEQIADVFSQTELSTEWILPEQEEELRGVLKKHLPELDALVLSSRNAYFDYLRSLNFTGSQPLIFLDVGYSGTIQKLLTHMLEQNTEGFYFIATNPGKHKIGNQRATMHWAFKQKVRMGDGYTMLDRSLFLESLLTAPDGQLIDLVKKSEFDAQPFEFLFGWQAYTQRNFHELDRVMQGAEAAVFHMFRNDIRYSVQEIETLYEQYTSRRNLLPRVAWPLFDVDDAISGHGNVNPLQLFGM
ncbi:HAD family hydrolase [Neptunicella sp. SCSIO 80796]|uniref:HAD family hydrolase n=1 Tax=Neptunicella plasticusilytica TaxID=3117012 RepID=UPI003A4E04DA